MKWYRCSFDYVLDKLSYANFILYGAVIPSFDSKHEAPKGKDNETHYIDPNDPTTWKKKRRKR